MTLHRNIGGTWTQVQRPYVKRSGVWAPVREAWVKRSGVWTQAYLYDVTPPSSPEISATVTDGRYITIAVRQPEVSNDTNIAMIRVLVRTDKYAGTQYDSGYVGTPDSTYPKEPWSEFYYNNYKIGTAAHDDTSVFYSKQYPPNPTASTDLPAGKRYYFSAFTMDVAGNWSAGTNLSIAMPSSGGDSNVYYRHARFQPYAGGSFDSTTYYPDEMIVRTLPTVRNSAYFYGSQLGDSIATGSNVTQAHVQVYRKNDTGAANANVYIYRHDDNDPPWSGTVTDVTKLGTIAKGQSKWFALPDDYLPYIENHTLRGIGFYRKDPAKAEALPEDYMELYGPGDDTGTINPGELSIIWTAG